MDANGSAWSASTREELIGAVEIVAACAPYNNGFVHTSYAVGAMAAF